MFNGEKKLSKFLTAFRKICFKAYVSFEFLLFNMIAKKII